MKLTATAVARPIGTGLIFAAVLVVGLVSVDQLAVDLLPEVDFPRISVVTRYEGVGPEEMETLITRPVEQTVSTVDGVEEISAVSSEGLSRVSLQFAWGADLDVAVADTRAYLDRLANRLPDDADRPVVYKFDLASVPIASLGLSGMGDPRRLRYIADETIARRLERISGIAAVGVRGGRSREIRVALDAARLTALRLPATEVISALSRDNRNVSAGDMRETGREVLVRAVGEWESVDDIGEVVVATREGRPVHLREVAEVRDTFEEIVNERWVDGVPGITLRVSKQSGANTVATVERLREEIEDINVEYQGQLRLVLLSNAADFIESAVTNVQTSALWGAILAVLVLLFFLHDLRATLLIAVAIPLSVVATFALMRFAGFTLNVISFGGLALGIGLLVDNAIVILENIYRKRDAGLRGLEAAVEGAREVAPAVIAGTLTTISVFAPVVFLAGFAGVFFGEMATVVAFALVCSLAVALSLVPTLAARAIRQRSQVSGSAATNRLSKGIERGVGWFEGLYVRSIERVLAMPWFTVATALLLLVASVRLADEVDAELMTQTDEGLIDVDLELPLGTPVEETKVVVKEFERRVKETLRPDELASMLSSAGPDAWWRPGGGHEGEVEINLNPASERERHIEEILADVREAVEGIPDVSLRIRPRSNNFLMRIMRGRSGERLAVDIRGHDLETAAQLGAQVEAAMKGVEGVSGVRVTRDEGLEERTVRVDARRAADVGLTRAEVADTLEIYVLGKVATRLRDGGDEHDVRVVLRDADRQAVDQLARLPIATATGVVPLSSVVDIGGRRGPASISRDGQERVLTVTASLGDRPLSAVTRDIDAALSEIERPAGFTVALAGEQEEQDEVFGGLTTGIVLALLLVFAVMGVQFESLTHPLIIMTAVPFGGIGVVAALVLTGTTFNLNSFLGAIMLVGIAVNNAIVLVDYTNLLRREQGFALVDAILEGGRRRLRPILMTTLTTGLAMLPIAVAPGEGSEIQAPLARVVIGGLLSSTFVTLVLVPVLYYLVERRKEAR